MSVEEKYDLIVVGGGAAGFFAAITCSERSGRSPRILILEKGPEVLQKVKISGGGRCNVTHDCHEPREFATHYPRGERALPGLLHRWNAADMIGWCEERGVSLKVESDGRVFPETDRSESVIRCFLDLAREHGIGIRCRSEVAGIVHDDGFVLELKDGKKLRAERVLVATGGIRNPGGARFARSFGHTVEPPAPSLFTFRIDDQRLKGLEGISVPAGAVTVDGERIRESGPILITHWGLSGPGILKASAKGARTLQDRGYQFGVRISWVGSHSTSELEGEFARYRENHGKQSVLGNPQLGIPSRLWRRLGEHAGIGEDTRWGNLGKKALERMVAELTAGQFLVSGKSMNKDEFVTCGGVVLGEVDLKTMESRLQPGLYFAGEVLDIDGVTGGFNFQSAWSTGRIAGEAIAKGIEATGGRGQEGGGRNRDL